MALSSSYPWSSLSGVPGTTMFLSLYSLVFPFSIIFVILSLLKVSVTIFPFLFVFISSNILKQLLNGGLRLMSGVKFMAYAMKRLKMVK